MNIKINRIEFHGNGSAGTSFHAVLFSTGRGKTKRDRVATVFPTRRVLAVLGMTTFLGGEDSQLDGPEFEDDLREAIYDFEQKRAGSALEPAEVCDLRYGKHEHVEGGHGISGTYEGMCVICGSCTVCARYSVERKSLTEGLALHDRPDGIACGGRTFNIPAWGGEPERGLYVPPALLAEVTGFVRDGQFIPAIKRLREVLHIGLYEGKTIADVLRDEARVAAVRL